MKLAAVQYRPPKGEPDKARQGLAELVDAAGRQGAGLIVCPEMATLGYVWSSPREVGPLTEAARGPTFATLAPIARAHGAWVVCGFGERFLHRPDEDDAGRPRQMASLYNSALVITPQGALATCYRKVCLFEADKAWANPGWRRPVVRTEFGRVAPGICMDLNDDGFIEHLEQTRPDVVAFCTNWIDQGEPVVPYWIERLGPWRGWFVAANTWGEDRGVQFSGRSTILGPGGEVVAQARRQGDEVLVVDIEETPVSWMGAPAEA